MKSNNNEKQFREEIVSIFPPGSDILSAKEYFSGKNIKYEIWDKQKSEATRVDKFLNINDKTLTAFYWIDNSGTGGNLAYALHTQGCAARGAQGIAAESPQESASALSEDLERKARFLARSAKNAPKDFFFPMAFI
ncbi:MAG: hypothetical protein LBK44_03230 [Spirochaetales bacterium]|jgi:hypothetical protein|nr:hypothetical protein [Spirochaetales bacterium]